MYCCFFSFKSFQSIHMLDKPGIQLMRLYFAGRHCQGYKIICPMEKETQDIARVSAGFNVGHMHR